MVSVMSNGVLPTYTDTSLSSILKGGEPELKKSVFELKKSVSQLEKSVIELERSVPEIGHTKAANAAQRLRQMLNETDELIVCPGVYDGLSARIALSVGFNALYMTGAGTTASRLGQPDLGIAQLHDMRTNAEMIANLDTSVPLIADMDTGFGGPMVIERSVSEYARAGVAAFHIEDQILQKRCGHLSGKNVVSLEEFLVRIRAAKQTKENLGSDIVLIARTDALQKHGYDECVRRLKAAQECGAEVAQLEGVNSREMGIQIVKDLYPMPVLLNMVEHGHMPVMSIQEAKEMGFRLMVFSFACLGSALMGIRETLLRLKNEGITGLPVEAQPRKIFDICGLEERMKIDEFAGGDAEKV